MKIKNIKIKKPRRTGELGRRPSHTLWLKSQAGARLRWPARSASWARDPTAAAKSSWAAVRQAGQSEARGPEQQEEFAAHARFKVCISHVPFVLSYLD